ncbi:MAG: hypothetical protein ACR2MG_16845 [Pyrinomonadaceae bacterium]
MNSEELEQSLRTEFEIYLKDILADMRQEMFQLQEKIETEFEKHKSQLDGVFRDFSTRIKTDKEIDDVFKETVVEHLRLARDEGARITATAIAEAEDMEKESAPKVGISELSDAINEITEQTSQAAILKTLVNQAAQFTPRGAFFIIKNEHFVGWRVFGEESSADEQTVREVFFPVATSTILGEAVRSLSAVESSYGTYAGDSLYLNKLEFGHPDKMFAIPLVARGRGVAVLYADYGTQGESVNVEALEVLVRIAGLTVELLAASQSAKPTRDSEQTQENYSQKQTVESSENKNEKTSTVYQFDKQPEQVETAEIYQPSADELKTAESHDSSNFEKPVENNYQSSVESDSSSFQPGSKSETTQTDFVPTDNYSYEEKQDFQPVEEKTPWNQPEETPTAEEKTPWNKPEETYSWNQPIETSDEYTPSYSDDVEVQDVSQSYQSPVSENDFSAPVSDDYQFEKTQQPFESSPFKATETFSSAKEETYDSFKADEEMESSFNEPAEAVSEFVSAAAPVKTRFSDRNVDLPIEVSEEERRLHNDARRFARLLVSEIKLYNEQKVKEGRDGSDLYERLREAIDRSREMYDKRVQPPVAAKFDYFHYELVSTLAEGEEGKLGGSYPGTNV